MSSAGVSSKRTHPDGGKLRDVGSWPLSSGATVADRGICCHHLSGLTGVAAHSKPGAH